VVHGIPHRFRLGLETSREETEVQLPGKGREAASVAPCSCRVQIATTTKIQSDGHTFNSDCEFDERYGEWES